MLVATPAVAADQFDLICTPTKGGKAVMRYRIDLQRGEWCAGSCPTTSKIADVTAGEIVLEAHVKAFASDSESKTTVNRTTGAWRTFDYDPKFDIVPLSRDGACQPVTFSGFPSAKF